MYSEDIEKVCGYCVHSKKTDDPFLMICEKNGEVPFRNVCKKFKYDIFKKKIHKRSRCEGKNFTADDFSID